MISFFTQSRTLSVIILSCFLATASAQQATEVNFTAGETGTAGFIENKGQVTDQEHHPNPAVKYLFNGNGINVQLKANGFSYDTYTIERKPKKETSQPLLSKFKLPDEDLVYHFHRIDVVLDSANANPEIIAEQPSEAYYNYFTTGTPEIGISKVHAFRKVTYKNIYPGIDLVFSCSPGRGFKYNFVVRPGGNYQQIHLKYEGANSVALQDDKIVISTANGNFTEDIPSSFTVKNKKPLTVYYKKISENVFGFSGAGNISHSQTFVIDPVPTLLWSTYFGGNGDDCGYFILTGANGNLFVDGRTKSTGNIATSGVWQTTYSANDDIFLAEFSPNGTNLIWATYYGGTGDDEAYSFVLDAADNTYLCGYTASSANIATPGTWQTTFGGNSDGFIAKFNSTGTTLLWATYYGGALDDAVNTLTLDASGNIYVTGWTRSTSGIATAGAWQTSYGGGPYDIIVAKFNPAGTSLLWGTYYGGSMSDYAYWLTLDGNDNIYIVGFSVSQSGIATPGALQTTMAGTGDAIVAKFNSTGTNLLWGTYFGGTGSDIGSDIVLDGTGNLYFGGITQSTGGIATPGALQPVYGGGAEDCFLAKMDTSGSSLLWSTYFGGPGYDNGLLITRDGNGNILVGGYTNSTTGISTAGAWQTTNAGLNDGFLAKINPAGNNLLWSTYYGGPGDDKTSEFYLGANGAIYLTGQTTSTTGISTPGVYQTNKSNGSNYDAFVAEFGDCSITASVTSDQAIYIGNGTTLNATGGTSYNWSPSYGLSCTNCASPSANPLQTTTYCVIVSDSTVCADTACTTVTVNTDCGEIFVPNAFSPNNDGVNDKLCVYGKRCITSMHFVIYDRWGEKVFESNTPEVCWDGTYKGKPMDSGVVVYYLTASLLNGQQVTKKGNIAIIR